MSKVMVLPLLITTLLVAVGTPLGVQAVASLQLPFLLDTFSCAATAVHIKISDTNKAPVVTILFGIPLSLAFTK
jgi:uncharacterized membrane protein